MAKDIPHQTGMRPSAPETLTMTDEFEDAIKKKKDSYVDKLAEQRAELEAVDSEVIKKKIIDGEIKLPTVYMDSFTIRSSPFMDLRPLVEHMNHNPFVMEKQGKGVDVTLDSLIERHFDNAGAYPIAYYPEKDKGVLLAIRAYSNNELRDPEQVGYSISENVRPYIKKGGIQGLLLNDEDFTKLVAFSKNPDARRRFLTLLDQDTTTQNSLWLILKGAIERGASDVHIEPTSPTHYRVRYRIDGICREIPQGFSNDALECIIRVAMNASGMSIVERKTVPQDGGILAGALHFVEKEEGRDRIIPLPQGYSFRTALMPTVYEKPKMTIRVLESTSRLKGLSELGFAGETIEGIERLLRQDKGIILVTGPTGSGKTTTLYACLEKLNDPKYNILTIEQPVERSIPGINQSPVTKDFGFGDSLRTYLRHDPDIILVGEIRDDETANVAIEASNTGHLVLSTLHTNDAVSSMLRLIELGVPGPFVANSLKGVLAQRLVRKICPQCSEAYDARGEISELAQDSEILNGPEIVAYRPRKNDNCVNCSGAGYRGRIPISELWIPNSGARKQMSLGCKEYDVYFKIAVDQGMKPLVCSGLDLALRGLTSLPELLEAVSIEEFERKDVVMPIIDKYKK